MKNILITGSTDGIGLATARILAEQGHRLWIHGRSLSKVEKAIQQIKAIAPRAQLSPFVCDLSEFASIRKAADQLKQECTTLDVLLNNAGVFCNELAVAPCGVEMTLTINHLGHFLLTLLLKDLLAKGNSPRVITVSSIAHTRGQLNPKDFTLTKNFDGYGVYAASKLANVLFAQKLARLWAPLGINSYSLHPGVIDTKLLRAGFGAVGAEVSQGAQTSVYLATTTKLPAPSGSYFDNQQPQPVARLAQDRALEDHLWDWSAKITEAPLA